MLCSPGKGGEQEGGGKAEKSLNDFAAEYAKSNRSTCKGCEQKIEKVKKFSISSFLSPVLIQTVAFIIASCLSSIWKALAELHFCVWGAAVPGQPTVKASFRHGGLGFKPDDPSFHLGIGAGWECCSPAFLWQESHHACCCPASWLLVGYLKSDLQ